MFIKNPAARKAVYAVLAALGAGAVAYGLIDQSTASMLVAAVGSLLVGQSALAGGNITPRVPVEDVREQVQSAVQEAVGPVVSQVPNVVGDVVAQAQAGVDAARAELERRIGLGR